MRRRPDADEDNDSRSDSPTVGRGNARLSIIDGTDGAPASIPCAAEAPILAPLLVPALAPASIPGLADLQSEASPSVARASDSHQSSLGQDETSASTSNPRVFDGQVVPGRKIQDCFNLYSFLALKLLSCLNTTANYPADSSACMPLSYQYCMQHQVQTNALSSLPSCSGSLSI